MIVHVKRKTKAIDGGVSKEQKVEKVAPGYKSEGYSYSSSSTKTFTEPTEEQDNAYKVGKAAGVLGSGAVLGFGYGQIKRDNAYKRANNNYNKDHHALEQKVKAREEALAKQGFFKKTLGKLGIGDSQAKINKDYRRWGENLEKNDKFAKGLVSGNRRKYALIGTGIAGAGMLAKGFMNRDK